MPWVFATLLLILALLFAAGEYLGWSFLAPALQKQFQQKTGRTLTLQAPGAAAVGKRFALHFWGGVRLQAGYLQISPPRWSKTPYLLSAQDVDIQLRYVDLWRVWRGQPLVVQTLGARQLTVYLERLADGRASWQLADGQASAGPPRVQNMQLQSGQLHYQDAPLQLDLDGEITLASSEPNQTAAPQPWNRVLRGSASGHWRKDPFTFSVQSTGALPWELERGEGLPVEIKLSASLGRAELDFDGTAQDFLHLNGLDGLFKVRGPSLAAIGQALGVTLPTTPAFSAAGRLQRNGQRWAVALQQAQVGVSRIRGDFVYDHARAPPLLTGTLRGPLVKATDLLPAIGVTPQEQGSKGSKGSKPAKVLPTRSFDLASLRAMDADVQIAIDQLDATTPLLESIRPFATRLQLTAGLLTLTGIEARTAQGHLSGTLALDGQQDRAHWVAALNWDGVQLQSWIRQPRAPGQPPYVTGQLQGHATLEGRGRSTAEILASLQGNIAASVERGTLSHLLVEAAGLDVAQALGVYVKGDNPLVLHCAVADVNVASGTLRPRLLVLDTSDSTIWADGSLSLQTEQIDMRLVVAPKDFSVLTLRAPIHLQGSFAAPQVSIEKGPLGAKLGSALLLGLINPLAAILPLVDTGNSQQARSNAVRCQAGVHQRIMQRWRK